MTTPHSPAEVLDREFLTIRAKLLEVAAALDRVDRAGDGADNDPRRKMLEEGAAVLASPSPNRAEQFQMLFSDPYLENWREEFGLS